MQELTLASMEKPGGETRSTSVSRNALSDAKPSSLINLPRERKIIRCASFGYSFRSNTVNHTKAIAAGLKALKLLGVEGVDLPIFWGVAETESPGNNQWSGYLAIAEMVKKTGFKLHVSLCFHGSKQPGLSLPDWVTHSYGGLGPDGELRYPSHQTRKLSDGAGEFQCYDKYMLVALKYMLWGLSGPHDAPSYDQRPNSAPFFSDGGSWESEYGDFFLAWYSSLLVSHADRVLSLASSVFSGTGLPLCGKLPLLHQWHKLRSRPSESTAGFYCNGDNDRYEAVAETFAKNSCRMILPGMDLSDEYQSPKSLSSPESLLAHIKTCCKKHGVVVSGQNSSEPNLGGFEKIKENLKDENAAIDLFTYQRMGALFFSPDHFHAFTEFVRNLSQFKQPEDDL
ncbi:unnamed protein product [Arabidopsis lyrata]|nr:unnamed protein product [Arabidopsis lyrata]